MSHAAPAPILAAASVINTAVVSSAVSLAASLITADVAS